MYIIEEELKKFDSAVGQKKQELERRMAYASFLAIQNIAEALRIIANRISDVEDWALIGSTQPSQMTKHKK